MHLRVSSGVPWPAERSRYLSVAADPLGSLTPHLLAKITLADIDHIRGWNQEHPLERTSPERLESLATDVQRLLTFDGPAGRP
jgi:hypothetical protein